MSWIAAQGFLTYLEVQIKFTDDLGSIWTVDGYCIGWEVRSFEGPLRCLGCDHSGKGCVPWNCLLYIAPAGYMTSSIISNIVGAKIPDQGVCLRAIVGTPVNL